MLVGYTHILGDSYTHINYGAADPPQCQGVYLPQWIETTLVGYTPHAW